jgi:predicted Rossmann fold flavoprotein
VRERFHALGVATVEEPFEKIFPASGRARDVRDALEGWARGAGVTIRCDAPVAGLERVGDAWRVRLTSGEALACRTLFVCPGGRSYAKSGTTGDGYAWLDALGLPVVAPAPALVPLTSPAAWVHELAGIALPDVDVRLLDATAKVTAQRPRPLLFTHRGVSGPGAMDVSESVARAPDAGWTLALDLLPAVTRESLRERFLARTEATGLANFLTRGFDVPLPRRLVDAVLASVAADAGASEPPWKLARTVRHELVEALKGLRVPVDGTLGYDAAEVTAGGLALPAVDPGSMRVRDAPGLHVFGELLDLTGPIGGFHFQSAFACAEVAASAAGGEDAVN